MDPFRISGVLGSRIHHSCVNFYSGEWEMTANVIFVFPFAPVSKEKKSVIVFP